MFARSLSRHRPRRQRRQCLKASQYLQGRDSIVEGMVLEESSGFPDRLPRHNPRKTYPSRIRRTLGALLQLVMSNCSHIDCWDGMEWPAVKFRDSGRWTTCEWPYRRWCAVGKSGDTRRWSSALKACIRIVPHSSEPCCWPDCTLPPSTHPAAITGAVICLVSNHCASSLG